MVLSALMATKRASKTAAARTASKSAPPPEPSKKIGRPRAKHSSPDYQQMSVYIHKEIRSKVKMRLFETGGEFSGLVESLLLGWLERE